MMMVLLMMVALSVVAGVMYRVTMSLRTVRFKQDVYLCRVIGALGFLAILLPGLVHAHGKVAMEEDPCVQRVGGNLVHFNAYQPQHAANAQYCTEIPAAGDTFLVVDLVDPSLRALPVGVRVVRGLSETADNQTVAYWPPTTHPDGVVRGEATLAQGLYTLIIAPEGLSSSSYLLRVQQLDYVTLARQAIGPVTLLLLLALLGYEFSKSTRWRNWRGFGQS
jgi:hypothetical protein